jgi:hypothetical protein
MKKLFTLSLLAFSLALFTSENVHAQAHQKGDVFLSPGFGLGTWGPLAPDVFAITFDARFGVHDYASVGPWAGFKFNPFVLGVGAMGTFHFWQLAADKSSANLAADQIDLYFSLYLGADIWTGGSTTRFRGSGALGFRWMPIQSVGLFTEIGNPNAVWTIGAAFRI